MRAELPPGTWCIRSKGKVYCYHQPGRGSKNPGERVRVPYTPDDPKFWIWHEERGVWGAPESGSVEDAVEQWLASPTFKGKAEITQCDYIRYAERMIERWGSRPIDHITREDALDWRREMEDRPAMANHTMAVVRSFWKWAIGANLASKSPVKDIEEFETNPQQANPWPQWALDLIEEHGRWELRAFVALGLYTGQRTADIVKMSLRDIENGEIKIAVQKKRGKEIWIPLHPRLEPIITEARKRGSICIMPRPNGKPQTAGGFRSIFFRAIKKGALRPIHEAGLSPHGLRVLAVNTLLELGCSVAEVSGITDQSLAVVERYAQQRNQRLLARRAMSRWAEASDGTEEEQ